MAIGQNVGLLKVLLQADSGEFKRQLDNADAAAQKFAGQIKISLGAGLAGAFSVAAIGAWGKSVIDAADRLGKLSERSGESVELINGLGYAAQMSGADIETMAAGLRNLNKRLSEAEGGDTRTNALLDSLGVKSRKAGEAVFELADAFPRLSAADRVRVSMDLLGKSGEALIPALSGGREALEGLVKEGQALNPITTELAKQSGLFNDALDKMSIALRASLLPALEAVLPLLIRFADQIGNAEKAGLSFSQKLGLGLASPFKTATDQVMRLEREIAKLEQSQRNPQMRSGRGVAAVRERTEQQLQDLRKELEYWKLEASRDIAGPPDVRGQRVADRIRPPGAGGGDNKKDTKPPRLVYERDAIGDLISREMEQGAKQAAELRQRIEELADPLRRYKDQIKEIEQAQADGVISPEVAGAALVAVYDDIDAALERMNPRMRELAAESERFRQIMAQTESAKLADVQRDIDLLTEKLRQGAISAKEFDEAIKVVNEGGKEKDANKDAFKDFADELRKQTTDAQLYSAVLSNAFNKSSDALSEFVTTGKLNFKSFAASMLADIAQIILKTMAMRAVLSLFGGALGGAAPAVASANGNVFSGGVQPFANGGAFTNSIVTSPTYFAFASGGAFRRGLMGEAGPEAVLPLARGRDGKLGVMPIGGGGASVVQNFYTTVQQAPDSTPEQTADRINARLRDQMRAVARDEITQQQRSGGSLRG
jgi:hypothetical protein